MTRDDEIVEEGRQSYYQHGDDPGLNPYVCGPGARPEATLWHRGFAAARAAKRAAQARAYAARGQPTRSDYQPTPLRWPPRAA